MECWPPTEAGYHIVGADELPHQGSNISREKIGVPVTLHIYAGPNAGKYPLRCFSD